jgi:beta-N-acetylhexosaminidase
MIMVAHLVHAELTEPGRPASLSPKAVQGLLRHQLNYQGLVVADGMQMGALRRFFTPDEAILLGIEAGVDLFIFTNREHPDAQMPQRFHRVVQAAIAGGRLTAARIGESHRRIAALERSLNARGA